MEDFLQSLAARFRKLSPGRRRWVLAGTVLGAFVLFLLTASRMSQPLTAARPGAPGSAVARQESPEGEVAHAQRNNAYHPPTLAAVRPGSDLDKSASIDPQIAYSAELSIRTKEFTRSRTALEEILDRHHGYVAKLRMVGQPSGSVLNATLRIPSSEYRSALTDLKSVGDVEHEEESADEITRQYNNFEARLLNAQSEERRLQQLLNERSPKYTDFTPVERQLAQLHTEMQRIQAERNAYASPVAFANISFSIEEQRTAPAETLAAQLKAAALSGFGDVIGTLATILLLVISHGPILFLWAILLYFPTRYVWRRRALWTLREAESEKTT